MLGDELVHFLEAHGVHIDLMMLGGNELVGTVAGLAGLAVEQRVGEAGHMAGRDPRLRIHDDRGVQTDVVGAFLHEFLEPRLFDVVLEFYAKRAVVPAVGQTAVYFRPRKNKAAALAERDDLIHGFFRAFHHKRISSCRQLIFWIIIHYYSRTGHKVNCAASFFAGSLLFFPFLCYTAK